MTTPDDVTDTLISGDPYDQAALSTRRFYPIGLRTKILVCILTVASTAVIAPATYYRRDLIATLEGESTIIGAIEPGFSALSLAGIAVTTLCASVLLRLLWLVETESVTVEEAITVIRVEDAVMTVAISMGAIIAGAGVLISLFGLLAPGLTAELYTSGVEIYAHASGLLAVDTRITSGIGFALSLGLLILYLLITGERNRIRARERSRRPAPS